MTVVFVLTDFGLTGTYCGQMKASLLAHLRDAAFVDLSNTIPPGDVASGAFHLRVAAPWIPAGSGVLAVVDPGVGTSRRAVLVRSAGSLFCGPDNGLLGWIDAAEAWLLPDPPAGASPTFHGRDLFAPELARALADPDRISSRLARTEASSLTRLRMPEPVDYGASIRTSVACIDSFGNCILWLSAADLGGRLPVSAETGRGRMTIRPGRTYDAEGLLLLEGSSGHLELAVPGGSASGITGLSAGDDVLLYLEKAP
jgi:S-adenosylmethionine hydrolase